jgi:hypothetical protein
MPHGFINPVFDATALPILERFETQRTESPADTQAVIVLPRWNSPIGKLWLPILRNYKCIHTYLACTYLFTLPHLPMNTLPWTHLVGISMFISLAILLENAKPQLGMTPAALNISRLCYTNHKVQRTHQNLMPKDPNFSLKTVHYVS